MEVDWKWFKQGGLQMMTVITCTNREMMMDNVFHNYSIQTMKNKELIIILNKDEMNLDVWRNEAKKYPSVTVCQLPERMMISECKNIAIRKAKYDHIAKFDDDDYYAPAYLQTAWDVFMKNPEADIVGKSSVYFYFQDRKLLCLFSSANENTWTDHVIDSTLSFKKDIFQHVRYRKWKVGTDKIFQRDCIAKGYNIFSTDRYNHTVIRRSNQHHTWKITEQSFIDICTNVVYTNDYQSIVTSPLLCYQSKKANYNN